MATINLGRIKPVFRGAYAGGTAYVIDDIVTSGDETFICILASTGNATSNATYWTKLAAKGTDGTDVGTTITTQGDVLYRDGSGLARLAAGTSGQFLKTQGAGANPVWAGSGLAMQSVVTGTTLTAVAGKAYPINTTSNACTITLPASASVGDELKFIDYARTWGTNAVTINTNSLNFQGGTTPNPVYNTNLQSVTIVYVDATQGWIPTVDDEVTWETPQPYNVDILVVGGGGSGGNGYGGGGGAGGLIYKTSHSLTGGQQYDAVIGAGGAGNNASGQSIGNVGADSTWTINGGATEFTAKGGGYGGAGANAGGDGGSGGGAGHDAGDGASENQSGESGDSSTYGFGFDGGDGTGPSNYNPGGGGGAGGAGDDGDGTASGVGGIGKDLSAVFATEGDSGWFASGGGGGWTGNGVSLAGSASSGGGTAGGTPGEGASSAATANTGGGSGGGASETGDSGAGGSGVICFKLLTSNYTGTVAGSPATRVVGDYTIVEFTGDGSYTA